LDRPAFLIHRALKKRLKRQASVVTKRYARAKEINGLFAKLSKTWTSRQAQNGKAADRETGSRRDAARLSSP
jgi:hypothetical protein